MCFPEVPLDGTCSVYRVTGRPPLATAQRIKLTGLGLQRFEQYHRAILEIQLILSTHLPPDSMQRWAPTVDRGHATVNASCRYYSPEGGYEADEEKEFPHEYDPFYHLRKRIPHGARHVSDNQVLYYELQRREGR